MCNVDFFFNERNLRRLRRSQGRWGFQRGEMQFAPKVAQREFTSR